MDAWIDFSLGPLLRISLTVLVLGLLFRFFVALGQAVAALRRAGDQELPTGKIAVSTLKWVFPVRLLNSRPLYSVLSILFHIGIILLALFVPAHALLVGFPRWWPALGGSFTDLMVAFALVGLLGLFVGRVSWNAARGLTKAQDVILLVVLFFLVLTGFMAANPAFSPVGARGMLLAHALLGNLALILTPTTKIAHCVLFPFVQYVSQLGWRNPAAAGRHVGIVLNKENEPV